MIRRIFGKARLAPGQLVVCDAIVEEHRASNATNDTKDRCNSGQVPNEAAPPNSSLPGRFVLHLLPALPSAWPEGSFKGLRARGGFEVDLEWQNSKPVAVRIKATVDGTLRLRDPLPGEEMKWNIKNTVHQDGVYMVNLKAGEVLTGRLPSGATSGKEKG